MEIKKKKEEKEKIDKKEAKLKVEADRLVESGRKVWKRAAQEYDEASFLNAFVNDQDESKSSSTIPAAEAAQEENPADYERYYKHYLSFYQQKYGVNDPNAKEEADAQARKEAAASKDTKAPPLPPPSKEPASKKEEEGTQKSANALGLIAAGYSDSDSE